MTLWCKHNTEYQTSLITVVGKQIMHNFSPSPTTAHFAFFRICLKIYWELTDAKCCAAFNKCPTLQSMADCPKMSHKNWVMSKILHKIKSTSHDLLETKTHFLFSNKPSNLPTFSRTIKLHNFSDKDLTNT
jgi:hypothetical protein